MFFCNLKENSFCGILKMYSQCSEKSSQYSSDDFLLSSFFISLTFFSSYDPVIISKGEGQEGDLQPTICFTLKSSVIKKISFGGSSLFLFVLRVNHQTEDFCTKIVHCMCSIGLLKNKPSKSYYFWVFVYIFSNHSN